MSLIWGETNRPGDRRVTHVTISHKGAKGGKFFESHHVDVKVPGHHMKDSPVVMDAIHKHLKKIGGFKGTLKVHDASHRWE